MKKPDAMRYAACSRRSPVNRYQPQFGPVVTAWKTVEEPSWAESDSGPRSDTLGKMARRSAADERIARRLRIELDIKPRLDFDDDEVTRPATPRAIRRYAESPKSEARSAA